MVRYRLVWIVMVFIMVGMVTRYTGHMVARCIGGLSQLPEVQMSGGKKSKKKLSNLTIRQTGLMVTRAPGT